MATERLEIYKCGVCGIIVEILADGVGELICCSEPMAAMKEQTADPATEKHVPIVVESGEGVKVVVGSTPHPMEEKHFIEWIEVIAGGRAQRCFLCPGEAPEARFEINSAEIDAVREYCNVHGLWKS